MFGLFKKKENKLVTPIREIPMPKTKEYKFLSRDEANKISQDFINSGEYDEGTLRLIRYIENGVKYNALHGFEKYEFANQNGCSFIKYNFNGDLLRKHFEERGYHIYTYKGDISSSGLYYKITISWEEN